jgi:hypothetical protein
MRSHIVLAAIIITICASTCYAFEPGIVGNSRGIVGLSSAWNSSESLGSSNVGNTASPSNSGSLCPFSNVSTELGELNILPPSAGLPTPSVWNHLDPPEIPHPLYSTGEINIPHMWGTPGTEILGSEAPSPFSHNVGTSDVPNNFNKSIVTTDIFSLCGRAGTSSTPHILNQSGGLGLSGVFQFHPSVSAGGTPLCPFANR